MNVLFLHVSRNSFGNFIQPSGLFLPFEQGTILRESLREWTSPPQFHKLVMVCPEEDVAFFRNETAFISENSQISLDVWGIPPGQPGSFCEENQFWDPVRLYVRDYFGLWNPALWEEAQRRYSSDKILAWNVESFWFLKNAHLNTFWKWLEKDDFVFLGESPEDLVLGADLGRARMEKSHVENRYRKQSLLEKDNALELSRHFFDPEKVLYLDKQRADALDKKPFQNFPENFLMREEGDPLAGDRGPLLENLKNNTAFISLRHHKGQRCLTEFQKLLASPETYERHASLRRFHPGIFRTEFPLPEDLRGDHRFFLESCYETLCWILEQKECVQDWSLRMNDFRKYKNKYSFRLIMESSFPVSAKEVEEFWNAGGSTWVFVADSWIKPGGEELLPGFRNLLAEYVEIREKHVGKYLLIKTPFLKDTVPLYLEWKHRLDGFVIVPSPGVPYEAPWEGDCSRVPYEMIYSSESGLQICPKISRKFNSGEVDAYRNHLNQAGKMSFCLPCNFRGDYGLSRLFHLIHIADTSFWKKYAWRTALQNAKQSLADGAYESFLNLSEEMLKHNPIYVPVKELLEEALKRIER